MNLLAAARGPLRRRLDAWWQSRSPRTDSLLLTQRNVYILPTRGGMLFCFTLGVLLIASINYQLNLGYVLTFLLTGSGVVSMHMTHNTLRGLTLHLRPLAPAFAGRFLLSALNHMPRWHKVDGPQTAVEVMQQFLDMVLYGLVVDQPPAAAPRASPRPRRKTTAVVRGT